MIKGHNRMKNNYTNCLKESNIQNTYKLEIIKKLRLYKKKCWMYKLN